MLKQRAARLTGRSGPDAEDLVQDTLERALRNLHRFEEGTNLHAWLSTIMQRLLIDEQRRRRPRRFTRLLVDLAAPEPEPEDDETLLLSAVSRVHELLAELPMEFRLVLELHAYKGLAYAEIARRLNLPVSTVGTRLLRARRLMRRYVGATAPPPARRCARPPHAVT